ncbi:MAG: nucleotidyltransferase domain-containing protein [Elusimicrobiaceae bacterium]|nr:nucleotidyltransferase domain-containing protein [Elusimicrobiaceae bacterium]
MKKSIIKKLEELEKEHHIKIFHAVESGSRAWGFASQDSDYDVRFLYYHRPEWYFSVSKQADNIVKMEEHNLLDFAGWELKKTLLLLIKGNMSLYEWIQSPIVYKQSKEFETLKALAQEFYNPKALLFSYVGLAENNYKAYADREKPKLKKYLYILRTLAACRWIEQQQTPPPIEMDNLKEVFRKDSLIWDFLNHLIEDKKKGTELGVIDSPALINRWIEEQLAYYTNFANSLPDLVKDTVPLSNFFYKTVMENKK